MNNPQPCDEDELEEGRANMLDADLLVAVESCDRTSQECNSLGNAPTISEDVSPSLQRQGAATAEANASPSDFENQTDDRWVIGTTSIILLNDGKVSVEDHEQVSTLIVDKGSCQSHPQASTNCSSRIKLLQYPDTHDFLPLDGVESVDEFMFFSPTCVLDPEEMALSTGTYRNDSTNLDKGDREMVQGDHLKSDSSASCLVLHRGSTRSNSWAGSAKYPNKYITSSKTLDTYFWSKIAPQDSTAGEQQEVLRYEKPELKETVISSGPQLHSSFCEESPDHMHSADATHLVWEIGEVTSKESLGSGRESHTRRDGLNYGVESGRPCHGTDATGAQEAGIQKLMSDPVEILVDPMDESEQSRTSSGLFGVTILFESNQQQTAKREFCRLIREHETMWQLAENKVEDMNRRLMLLESNFVKLQENVVIAQTDTQGWMPVNNGRHPVEPNRNDFPSGFTSIYQSSIFVPCTGSYDEDAFKLAPTKASLENGDDLFGELEEVGGSTIFGQFDEHSEIRKDEEVALCDECSEQVIFVLN